MVEKICKFLINRIKKEIPDLTPEREEAIFFGLQVLVGEIPKTFVLIAIAFLLGVGELTIITFLILMPYRTFSGGFHLKTHLGCIIGTTLFFSGNAMISKYLILPKEVMIATAIGVWIFSMMMIKKYAPADTENVPIISKKQRRKQKILSYLTMTLTLVIGMLWQDPIINNICVIGVLLQTLAITRIVYKLTNNKYGYEVYQKEMDQTISA